MAYAAGLLFSNTEDISDAYIGIAPCDIQDLSDAEIIGIMREGTAVAEFMTAAMIVFQVIDTFKSQPSPLWRIEEFQGEFEREYEILHRNRHRKGAQALIEKFEPIWQGNLPDAGYIYCLSDQQGHYKLGRTKQLQTRLRALGTQPPFKIQLLFTHYVFNAPRYEKLLHQHFAKKRMNGEWFALDDSDIELIRTGTWTHSYEN
jgi:hypothetical protein